jgi:cytochrome P450
MTGLVSDNGFLGATGWTDYWRKGRRFAQSMLSTSNIQQSLPTQTLEARQMVVDLMKQPSRYAYWLERAGVMTSLKQIYGQRVERGTAEEHHVDEITSYMETIDRVAAPGVYLVEFLPWLQKLPAWLAPFKKEAAGLLHRHWSYMAPLIKHQGTPNTPESFAGRYLRSKGDWGLTDREMVWVLSSIYGGASGTSSAAMQSIILNMCLFPDWQRRMQKEIDDVVDNRLPQYEDSPLLPTVRAVIKESMRWRPVLSGGTLLSSSGTALLNRHRISTCCDQGRCLRRLSHPERSCAHPKSMEFAAGSGDIPRPRPLSTRAVAEIRFSNLSRTTDHIPQPETVCGIWPWKKDLSRA